MSGVAPSRAGHNPTRGSGDIRSIEQVRHDSTVGVGEIETLALQPGAAPDFSDETSALLPPAPVVAQSAIDPLTDLLGPLLTVANPAWGADPVPAMRMLQKKLITHSLALNPGSRGACMGAISVVEQAVTLRLRFQQMRMSELEMHAKTGTGNES